MQRHDTHYSQISSILSLHSLQGQGNKTFTVEDIASNFKGTTTLSILSLHSSQGVKDKATIPSESTWSVPASRLMLETPPNCGCGGWIDVESSKKYSRETLETPPNCRHRIVAETVGCEVNQEVLSRVHAGQRHLARFPPAVER